jgi:hypothetical protein
LRWRTDGCARLKKRLTPDDDSASCKSERSEIDSSAPMGYGATRSLERVAAAMGALEAAPIVFEAARDIPQGGVLLALPALMAAGLLRHSAELYTLPNGFYGLSRVLVLLAPMALARIGSIEQLRYAAAGGVGKPAGIGPDSGSAHAARETEAAVHGAGPGGALECGLGQGMDQPAGNRAVLRSGVLH